ncbi:MAG: adenosylhomocysteinase [Candidatus Bathyarchaeia archaeon]
MKDFHVKDPSLAQQGSLSIAWAESRMPVLMAIRKEFDKRKPFQSRRICACLHVTKETAVLARTLQAGGAEVALCGSNPLSTQDDVAACLARDGINVFAWRGQTTNEYYKCIDEVINFEPEITLDDGADLVSRLHNERKESIESVIGGTEETTTGIIRLKAMANAKSLRYPIIAVNDAHTKYLFDNRYGTGQSTIDGILRATSVLLAGKNLVVCGYGWCGRGIAMRSRGMGANVVVTEVDPVRALEASMDGFSVMPLSKAAVVGDLFVTATGNLNVIRKEHLEIMRNGAILANSGHFNVEISLKDLEAISTEKATIRPNVEEHSLRNGKRLYLVAEGRLVNLAAAEGHPPEVMMMSFANQALCAEYLALRSKNLTAQVHLVPAEIDEKVAKLALTTQGIELDSLTEEQLDYLKTWTGGTS